MLKINGITLTSLVIIIVILIIIAGVVINLSLGENSLLSKAKQAKEHTNRQAATEKINLKITTAQVNNYSEKQEMITLKELSLILKDDDEIEYVTEQKQKINIKYEVSENPKSIFTKLKDYPYEFEIDSTLKLISIDEIKIGNAEKEDVIPEGYIKPSGTKIITENGNYDISQYANAEVNVPIPEGYVQPSGTKKITTKSSEIDVSNYKYADTTSLCTVNEGIYKVGTYNSVSVSAGTALCTRLTNANTININIKERYSDYTKLTTNNFLAVDSVYGGKSYPSMTSGIKEAHSYSSQIINYNANTGVLTILKAFGCFDDGRNTYDTCFLGSTTIYLIENAEIPDL